MADLIEALTIFLKYSDEKYPTTCEHECLYVLVDPKEVSDEDKDRLDELGFIPGEEYRESFVSYRFGSA